MIEGFGHFEGVVQTEWLPDGRKMILLSDLIYTDQSGVTWKALKGDKIDGASIPRAFWTLVGPPFVGLYRDASVVHDVACQKEERPWEWVHRMFYHACRCLGVEEIKAKIMFGFVFGYGPRWEIDDNPVSPLFLESPDPNQVEQDIRRLREWITRKNPTLEDIEAFNWKVAGP